MKAPSCEGKKGSRFFQRNTDSLIIHEKRFFRFSAKPEFSWGNSVRTLKDNIGHYSLENHQIRWKSPPPQGVAWWRRSPIFGQFLCVKAWLQNEIVDTGVMCDESLKLRLYKGMISRILGVICQKLSREGVIRGPLKKLLQIWSCLKIIFCLQIQKEN